MGHGEIEEESKIKIKLVNFQSQNFLAMKKLNTFHRKLWTIINEICIRLLFFMIMPEFQKYKNDFLKYINRFLDFQTLCNIEDISPNNHVVL